MGFSMGCNDSLSNIMESGETPCSLNAEMSKTKVRRQTISHELIGHYLGTAAGACTRDTLFHYMYVCQSLVSDPAS